MDFSQDKKNILEANGNLLIVGGPGAGKTTIAIIKAQKECKNLLDEQQVLFLSFARSTVARVIDAIKENPDVTVTTKHSLNVDTYHSFFWQILNNFGYLLGLPKNLQILTPSDEAVFLSPIRCDNKNDENIKELLDKERFRLATQEGKICFDLFAEFVIELLEKSTKIKALICSKYPLIVLDEFQDTNSSQWEVIKRIGTKSTLIALADPEQRIYDFIGADPERLNQFSRFFSPIIFNLNDENHRSNGTEILLFGNELLKATFSKSSYIGIDYQIYIPYKKVAFSTLRTTVFQARKRLIDSKIKNWSLGVLVPTKKMMRLVSDDFSVNKIYHHAMIDTEGAILSAQVIAFLLQPQSTTKDLKIFITLVCDFLRGKNGDKPSKTNITQSNIILKDLGEYIIKNKIRKKSIFEQLLLTYKALVNVSFSGFPMNDWILIRKILEESDCKILNILAEESKDLRLLTRGSNINESLSNLWNEFHYYNNAQKVIKDLFIQEHFATSLTKDRGIIIMNMHKSKGKQFDEVIIFEGCPIKFPNGSVLNLDRIVPFNISENINSAVKQTMRVAITRAKQKTTILTPKGDTCVLF